MKRRTTMLWLAAALLAAAVFARPVAAAEIPIEIGFPGLTKPCSFNAAQQCVGSLGEYINVIYRWFSGAVGIIAVVMVMWGGIKWMTALGSSGKVEDAKQTIYSAVLAIILVLGSYLLLFTINPELVKLDLPVATVDPVSVTRHRCADYPPSQIVVTYRASADKDACGARGLVVIDGETTPCYWDVCDKASDVCVLDDEKTTGSCENTFDLCEGQSRTQTSETRLAYCVEIDTLFADAKQYDGTRALPTVGCGIASPSAASCATGKLFTGFSDSYFSTRGLEQGFQPCTSGPEGVCWETDTAGNRTPKSLDGHVCADSGSEPRGVSGPEGHEINAGCVRHRDGTHTETDGYELILPKT